ncbi:MAG: TadG family pilus assembly protein [Sphingomonas oligoaromativorans]
MLVFKRHLRGIAHDRRGSVTILTVAAMTALLASTAFAVDMGSVYLANRKLQGVADAAALAAVGTSGAATAAAQQVIADNRLTDAQVAALVPGTYTPDGSIKPAQRFVPGTPSTNAVQVTLVQSVPLFFGGAITGRRSTQVRATALAARIDYAAFSIGTRLASVQGGLPGALLNALAGTDLNLSVADYNALVGTQIDLLSFSKQLATKLDLTGASFNDTLNAKATLPQILSALAAASTNPAATSALNALSLRVPSTTVQLSNLIDLGPYGSQDHADPSTVISSDGYSIVREMLQLANGSRQVSTDLGVDLPGAASTNLTLAIGQRAEHSPWLSVAQGGNVTVHTSQARLYLDTKLLDGSGLASVHLPLYVELAEAQAKLSSITCQKRNNATVGLSVLPSLGNVAIGAVDMSKLNDFSTPETPSPVSVANVLSLLANVTAQSQIQLGGASPNWQTLAFNQSQIDSHTVQTVQTPDLVQGITASLVSNMKLKVQVLGLGLDVDNITKSVRSLLTPVAPALDGLLDQVTNLLGVHVGQADLQVNGVRCGTPSLVA